MKTVREYLVELLEYIGYLESFAVEGVDTLKNDIKTEPAVRKAYEIIGEIAKRLPDALLEQHPQAEWKQLKGFRDFLAHNYDNIVLKVVWDSVEKLPTLRAAIETLLAGLDNTNSVGQLREFGQWA